MRRRERERRHRPVAEAVTRVGATGSISAGEGERCDGILLVAPGDRAGSRAQFVALIDPLV